MSTNQIIQEIFKDAYFDLGVFRWLNRNKAGVKYFVIIGLIMGLAFVWLTLSLLVTWGGIFILGAILGAIDHILIRIVLWRILRKLDAIGIHISRETLLAICQDIEPK